MNRNSQNATGNIIALLTALKEMIEKQEARDRHRRTRLNKKMYDKLIDPENMYLN